MLGLSLKGNLSACIAQAVLRQRLAWLPDAVTEVNQHCRIRDLSFSNLDNYKEVDLILWP